VREYREYLEIATKLTTITNPDNSLTINSLEERLKLNPLTFWNEHQNLFPNLSKVARSILAVQATSAASERIFSNGGFIGNHHRNRLSADALEVCTLVRDALAQNIDLRKMVQDIWKEKKESANKKRSVAQTKLIEMRSAAKKARQDDSDDTESSSSVSEESTFHGDVVLTVDDSDEERKPKETDSEGVKIRRREIESLLVDDEDLKELHVTQRAMEEEEPHVDTGLTSVSAIAEPCTKLVFPENEETT